MSRISDVASRRERIERKASLKIHHGHDRSAIGLQYLARPAPKMPADQADGTDECSSSNQEVSSSPSRSEPVRPTTIFAVRRFHAKIPARSHRTPYPKSASTIKSLVRIMEG